MGAHHGIAKDSELSALVSQPVIPPIPISLPPQGNIESGLSAQVDTSEIQSAGPKPVAVVSLKKHIFVSRLSPDQTSSDLLIHQLVVLGDFKIPGIMWSEQSNILLPLAQHDFIDGLLDLSLSQVNYIRNSLG